MIEVKSGFKRPKRTRGRGLSAALAGLAAATLGLAADAGAASACSAVLATVSVSWDAARAEKATGVVARVAYPVGVDVPIDHDGGSAVSRVERVAAPPGGLFDAIRRVGDGQRRLNVGLVTPGIAPGDFVRIRFDCVAGAPEPRDDAFSCTAEVSDGASLVAAQCRVRLAPADAKAAPR